MTDVVQESFFKQLVKRRVFQIVGIYLGAIVAMMEFSSMVIERYGVTDRVVDLVLAGMTSFIPAVIMLAWRHGAPGKDEWGKVEKIGLPLNTAITFFILLSLSFSSPEVTDATHQAAPESPAATIAGGSAETVTMKRIMVFFTNTADKIDMAEVWQNYAFAFLVSAQLHQNQFIQSQSFYSDISNSSVWLAQRAGFKDALNLPTSLMHSIALDSDSQFYIRSNLEKADLNYQLAIELFETESNRPLASANFVGDEIFSLAKQATEFLKQQKVLQAQSSNSINEIPLQELVTGNDEAMKLFTDGLNEVIFNNDYRSAEKKLQSAIEIDPQFAMAHIHLAEIYGNMGELDKGAFHSQKALSMDYKLTERTRFIMKAASYAFKLKTEQAQNVYRNWIELYPNDYLPYYRLANTLTWKGGDLKEILTNYLKSFELNPAQSWLLMRIAETYHQLGDTDNAKRYYQLYADRKGNSYVPLVRMGYIAMETGELDEADKLFNKSALIRTDKVQPVLALSTLHLRRGELNKAQEKLEEALMISQAPNQLGSVYAKYIEFYVETGQLQKAYQQVKLLQSILPEYERPMEMMFSGYIAYMYIYGMTGHQDEARAELEQFRDKIDESFKDFVEMGYLYLELSLDNADTAEKRLPVVLEMIKKFNSNHVLYLAVMSEGWINQLKGNYQQAELLYKKALGMYYESAHRRLNENLGADIHFSIIQSLRQAGKSEEAIELAQSYLQQWPYHASINLELAELYLAQNEKDKATKPIERASFILALGDEDYVEMKRLQKLKGLLSK